MNFKKKLFISVIVVAIIAVILVSPNLLDIFGPNYDEHTEYIIFGDVKATSSSVNITDFSSYIPGEWRPSGSSGANNDPYTRYTYVNEQYGSLSGDVSFEVNLDDIDWYLTREWKSNVYSILSEGTNHRETNENSVGDPLPSYENETELIKYADDNIVNMIEDSYTKKRGWDDSCSITVYYPGGGSTLDLENVNLKVVDNKLTINGKCHGSTSLMNLTKMKHYPLELNLMNYDKNELISLKVRSPDNSVNIDAARQLR